MKRLLVTSTDLMMIQFLVPHIMYLAENGYEVEIACSNVGGRMDEVREKLGTAVKKIHTVHLHRSPLAFGNLKGYKDMRCVIDGAKYDVIWTNEPVMGVVTRLAARKARKHGTKVLYMVHGFHFFKGASPLNWMIYYPIERFASRFCDEIVTINTEDKRLAERKMHAPKVGFIHGIGVDDGKFHPISDEERTAVRAAEGLTDDDFVVICVGELNENKNQKTLIEAAALLKDSVPQLKVLLAGKGNKEPELRKQIRCLGLDGTVRLLGYRTDLPRLIPASDLAVSCSMREGLGVNLIEAMLCGKPVVASHNRGHDELVKYGKTGYLLDANDTSAFAEKILELASDQSRRKEFGLNAFKIVKPYSIDKVKMELMFILREYGARQKMTLRSAYDKRKLL